MKKVLKFVYAHLPFKKQVFIALRVLFKPGEAIYKHLHFTGIINIKVSPQASFKIMHYGYQIENEIFWAGLTGGWEKKSMELWIQLCSTSNIILDVGANTGIYSLVAKALNPGAEVYAFEPVERIFKKLLANNELNNYNIKCREVALSNYNGTAVIFDIPADHVYSVTVNKNLNGADNVIERQINAVMLDTFIANEKIKKIDLIKIDVETHEAQVLEGFKNNLSKFLPTILIEILNDEVGRNVQKIVEGMGYWYFNIDEKNSVKRVEILTKSDCFNYLLCSPEKARLLNLI